MLYLSQAIGRPVRDRNGEPIGKVADLIVAGAFGHSRFRELVLGGVTRRMLADAKIPVLFSR